MELLLHWLESIQTKQTLESEREPHGKNGIFSHITFDRYIFGFILVTICFVFIFRENNSTDQGARIAYYIFFPSAFNVGWASVQVAHMSLVPSLTLSRKTRDKLNNFRNTFTYIANLYVLLLAFILFLTLK